MRVAVVLPYRVREPHLQVVGLHVVAERERALFLLQLVAPFLLLPVLPEVREPLVELPLETVRHVPVFLVFPVAVRVAQPAPFVVLLHLLPVVVEVRP